MFLYEVAQTILHSNTSAETSSAGIEFTIQQQYKDTPIIYAPSSHKKRLGKRDKTEEQAAPI